MAAAMPETTGAAPGGRVRGRGDRAKGPRPKHVPQRMCVACRQHDAKRGLIRIVRTPEGTVTVDPSGRQNGRGSYLCHQAACWERALSSGLLSRALKTEITAETVATLRRHAEKLQPAAVTAATEGGIA
ncbi:MAG: YlxR family protein [Chloroflexota bacterium]|nr:YlxR family protein [Chloroflexota bacterium]